MKYLLLFFIIISFSCNVIKPDLTAQDIIDTSIKMSGTDKVEDAEISFKFRDKQYSAKRNFGEFSLTRTTGDSIKDVLSNDGFERFINAESVKVTDSLASVYSNSVNSVHYFSVLPYGLNDKAVIKKLLEPVQINGKNYYKIEVTFSENGGGKDFEDVFIYWIGKDDFLIQYLAYSYHTDGGGMRFRALKNDTIINSIRFVNYDNYKPIQESLKLNRIDKAFEDGKLVKVSEIVLENISVK